MNKSKINQKGVCPIKCRITYLRRRKEFATGEFISPVLWISKKQKVAPGGPNNEQINFQLEIIASNLKKEFLQLQLQKKSFTVLDIVNTYFKVSEKQKEVHVIKYFEEFLKKQRKLIGLTWRKLHGRSSIMLVDKLETSSNGDLANFYQC